MKAQILAECAVSGASVAKVAMAYGINANIVRGRRKLARDAGAVTVSQQFVPGAVAPTAVPSADKQASAMSSIGCLLSEQVGSWISFRIDGRT